MVTTISGRWFAPVKKWWDTLWWLKLGPSRVPVPKAPPALLCSNYMKLCCCPFWVLLHGGPPVNNKRVYGKHKSRQTLVPGVVNLVLKLLIIFSSQQYLCQTILWSTQPSEPFFCFPSPIKKRKRTHSLLPDELSWHKYFCQPNVHYFQVRCARSSPQALNLTSVL